MWAIYWSNNIFMTHIVTPLAVHMKKPLSKFGHSCKELNMSSLHLLEFLEYTDYVSWTHAGLCKRHKNQSLIR